MNPRIFETRLVCAVAVAVAVAIASPCAAQSSQPPVGGNPFAGLFKGSPKEQRHKLDLNGSTFVAWDDNVLAQAPGSPDQLAVDPRGVRQGIANGFQTSAVYGFHTAGTRSRLNAEAQASLQQFASSAGQDPLLFESYDAVVGLQTGITPKISFSLSGASSYAPYYQYAPFLRSTTSEESPVGNDYGYAANSNWVLTNSATVSIEDRFSKRSGISGGIRWDQRNMTDQPDLNVETRSANARLSHNLTKKLAVHIGYIIQESRYKSRPAEEPLRVHNLDLGLGYGDGITISFARHYTLSLSVGASIARNGDPFSVATTEQSTVFVVTGGATLSRSIGRAWGASLGYTRGTNYVIGFPQPLITDAASAGVGGPIFGRLHFSAGGGASRGQQLFSTDGGTLVSYSASTKLTFALFKHLGLYTQASYYKYSVPESFQLFGLTPDLDRRSVSAGLSAWLPLIKPPRVRRTNDPTQQDDRDSR